MKIFAFIKKDLLITVSYRFRIILQFVSMLLSLIMYYFLSKTFSGAVSPYLGQYSGNYFSYVLVGIAVSSFVTVGLNALADEVRSAQVEGTLEALLSTPTSIYTILVGNSIWSFIEALFGSIIIFSFGVVFIGLKITIFQIIIGFFILIITSLAFLSVGMLSASFIMIFKQGNPIGMIFGASSYFLGGVIFPVEVLPEPFQYLAKLLPMTHAVKALRELLLMQASLSAIKPVLFNLFLFIVLMAPVSIIAFRYSVNRARKEGSLLQY